MTQVLYGPRLGKEGQLRVGCSAVIFDELSMGTSSDYEAAVQEGATLVRVGTAIVGPRQYKTEV